MSTCIDEYEDENEEEDEYQSEYEEEDLKYFDSFDPLDSAIMELSDWKELWVLDEFRVIRPQHYVWHVAVGGRDSRASIREQGLLARLDSRGNRRVFANNQSESMERFYPFCIFGLFGYAGRPYFDRDTHGATVDVWRIDKWGCDVRWYIDALLEWEMSTRAKPGDFICTFCDIPPSCLKLYTPLIHPEQPHARPRITTIRHDGAASVCSQLPLMPVDEGDALSGYAGTT